MKRIFLKTTSSQWRFYSSATAKTCLPNEVPITPSIKKSPTAVLEALSTTIGIDPTAPHFSFIDDPAMIPTEDDQKRRYYMAKEMGKRAARQLAEEWPTLFAFDRDQPELPVFRPVKAADPLQVDPTEANLLAMIHKREVKDAVMLYERMRSENIDVSDPVQLELFKLVCYYNGDNPPFNEIEEWHGIRNFGQIQSSNWIQGGTADLLFETLPKTAETISAMISGLAKFGGRQNRTRIRELYAENLPKGMLLRNAFDGMILVAKWSSVQSILTDMKAQGIKPSVSTFNSALLSMMDIKSNKERYKVYQKIFGEMHAVEVTPTLTTFDIVLSSMLQTWRSEFTENGLQKDKNPELFSNMQVTLTCLIEILKELEIRPNITLEDPNDSKFFHTAMRIASLVGNIDIAEQILKLYTSSKNHVKMPTFTTEASFYNKYLILYIESAASIEDIADKYRYLVPRKVGINAGLTKSVLNRLKESKNWSLLRRVIEDGVSGRQIRNMDLSYRFREALMKVEFASLNVSEREEFTALVKKLVDIWVEFSNFKQKLIQIKLHPKAISECAVLLNRIGESDQAYRLLELILNPEKCQGENATVFPTGFANPILIMELFEDALREGDVYKAATCLEVLSQNMPKNRLEGLALRIRSTCKLTDSQSQLIDGFVRLRPE